MNKKPLKWDSEFYKEHASSQEERALSIIKSISFKNDDHILDIGCGNGKITNLLSKKVGNGFVIGIDISENMISQAKKDFVNENLTFFVMNAESFHFSNKFNYIFSFNALHWVEDFEAVVKNIKDNLEIGGEVYLLFAFGKKEPAMDEVVFKTNWINHLKILHEFRDRTSKLNFIEIFKNQGFNNITIEYVDIEHEFSNVKDLKNQIMTWLPAVSDLDDRNNNELADEIAFSFAKYSKTSKIIYSVPMVFIRAKLL